MKTGKIILVLLLFGFLSAAGQDLSKPMWSDSTRMAYVKEYLHIGLNQLNDIHIKNQCFKGLLNFLKTVKGN